MLEILPVSNGDGRITYALKGEITMDQMARLEALVRSGVQRGRAITLDVEGVWRVDRDAAGLFAYHARRPNNEVRIVGVSVGLLQWLRSVSNERS